MVKRQMDKSKFDRSSKNKADQDYYVKYRHDHVFVIRDNKLKYYIEVMIRKRTFYRAFHDTRNSLHVYSGRILYKLSGTCFIHFHPFVTRQCRIIPAGSL